MNNFRTLDDLEPGGKTCLVRVDLNVPMSDGQVTDVTRITRILPTLNELCAGRAKVILLAHFGRPKGQRVEAMSLEQIVPALAEQLKRPVAFAEDCEGEVAKKAIHSIEFGDVLLLENTRFHAGEEKNDSELANSMASLGDVFVNDAFSASHRAHVTTEGLAHHLPSYAGRTMQAELDALNSGLGSPEHPVMAVVGGAKVSTKLELLQNLTKKVDMLVIGGGMANTFLAAQGINVGSSLCEHDLADTARKIMASATSNECEIILPVDVVVANEFRAGAANHVTTVDGVKGDEMILDTGPQSAENIISKMNFARTLVWNGPLGAFEIEPFDAATTATAKHAADLTQKGSLTTIAGGGDTVSALNHAGVADGFSYISTAGGAFLEWMEGKVLPGVEALKISA